VIFILFNKKSYLLLFLLNNEPKSIIIVPIDTRRNITCTDAQISQGVKHMSISIQAKTDYSSLFSSLSNTKNSSGTSTFLADYASIKNGSYYKLMKAYYGKGNDSVNSIVNNSTSSDDSKTLANIQSSTDALKESADALLSKSLFTQKDITTTDENGEKTTTTGYDVDSIYKAVSQFVSDYNSVINTAGSSSSKSIQNSVLGMTGTTTSNIKLLNKLGITIGTDGKLSLAEDTFKKADMGTAKTLFNGNGSYAYRISAQSSMINLTADREASKAATYNYAGNYASNYSSGNIFSSYF